MTAHADRSGLNGDVAPLDGRRLRWQEHNQTRRGTIIEAAIAVLETQQPGDELHVQQIADEAGLSRTVVYRHFQDRAELDRAVQRRICEMLGTELLPALDFDGTPEEIVRRVVEAFVRWAVQHPTLHWFAERDLPGWGPSPMAEALEGLAAGIEAIVTTVVQASGVELSADDRASVDPWVFGLIGSAFSSVRRWLTRPGERRPDTHQFVKALANAVWVQVDGMAGSRGITVPDLPVADMLHALGNDA